MKGPPAPGYSNEPPALRPKRSGADPLIGILAKRSQPVKVFRFTHRKSFAGETFFSFSKPITQGIIPVSNGFKFKDSSSLLKDPRTLKIIIKLLQFKGSVHFGALSVVHIGEEMFSLTLRPT